MPPEIIIRHPRTGEVYGVKDAATARRLHPEFEILGNQGEVYLGADAGPGEAADGSATNEVTGYLDSGELSKLTREQLNDLATEMKVDNPAGYPNKDAIIAELIAIPVTASAEDEEPDDGDPDE